MPAASPWVMAMGNDEGVGIYALMVNDRWSMN